MAEERRCPAPRLCANNCGFFGSPAMQDLCSKCYRDLQLKEQQSSSAQQALTQTLSSPSASASTSSASLLSTSSDLDVSSARGGGVNVDDHRGGVVVDHDLVPTVASTTTATCSGNRCEACRRKVGLTGFRCRCGMVLCGTHRYPEQHGCGFDFRCMGKEQIARANPVIKAPKLNKI